MRSEAQSVRRVMSPPLSFTLEVQRRIGEYYGVAYELRLEDVLVKRWEEDDSKTGFDDAVYERHGLELVAAKLREVFA